MNPVRSNLVALGSAAVLAVYAAGYVRTKPAADRFTGQDSERRDAAPLAVDARYATSPLPETARADDSVHRIVDTTNAHPARAAHPAAGTIDSSPAAHASAPAILPPVPSAAASDTVRAVDSTLVPKAVTAALPIAVPAGIAPDTATSPPADTAAQTPPKEQGQFKDGVYSGWGSSRHGDIEASVEVRDGRIVSASISQCLMHYSCSWISALPPQVVARQSANVDYVSGATQSANAFYYAIVDALAKAK